MPSRQLDQPATISHPAAGMDVTDIIAIGTDGDGMTGAVMDGMAAITMAVIMAVAAKPLEDSLSM